MGKFKANQLQNMFIRALLLSPLALLIGGVIAATMTVILNSVPETFGTLVSLSLAALLLAFSLSINPRVENFIADFPIVLLITGITSLISIYITTLSLTLEFAPISLATVFTAVYLAEAIMTQTKFYRDLL